MKVYFSNTGCSLHFEDFMRFLRLTGGEETKDLLKADVIVAHFCALSTGSFEIIPFCMAVFNGLKTYARLTHPKLFVGGCASEVVDLAKRYPFVDGTFRRGKMVEDLAEYFGYDPKSDENLPINCYGCVRIQTGCLRHCGFCKKAYLSMPLNSKKPEQVISDVKCAVSNGFHRIILLAENSTEYGIDLPGKVRLIDLLKAITSISGVSLLDVNGLCIDELVKNPELVDFLKDCEIIHKLQIEVQSLIPEVRKNMGLSSSTEEVLEVLKKLERKHIVSSIMLGYPGETAKGFAAELELIKAHQLYFLQPNAYDDTPCVPAHNLPQIPKKVVDQRLQEFLKAIKRIRREETDRIISESQQNPIECIYTDGRFEAIGHSVSVLPNKGKQYTPGDIVWFRVSGIVTLLDELDPNKSMILEGDPVRERI